jgi:hypothetical protein
LHFHAGGRQPILDRIQHPAPIGRHRRKHDKGGS